MMPPNRNRPPVSAGRAAKSKLQRNQSSTKANTLQIAKALMLRPAGVKAWQGDCPACGYLGAFSLTDRDGSALWHCHACGDGKAVRDSLVRMGLLNGSGRAVHRHRPLLATHRAVSPATHTHRELINRIWQEAVPIAGTLAERYLASRGITGLMPHSLRFHPECWHSPTEQAHPALLAAVSLWPDDGLLALQRVYLLPDGSGKLAHPQPRMMLGSVRGGAVRLAPVAEVMGVAEGLETALSVQDATGLPMWAGLSTGGMQAVIWPESVRHVIICADHDKPGLAAAHAAAEALIRQGKGVSIAKPSKAGADFNDLLQEAGHE